MDFASGLKDQAPRIYSISIGFPKGYHQFTFGKLGCFHTEGWGSEYDAAVDAAVAGACGGVENVDSYNDLISGISFGIKEMNPGPGKSQDKIKVKIEIYPTADSECVI